MSLSFGSFNLQDVVGHLNEKSITFNFSIVRRPSGSNSWQVLIDAIVTADAADADADADVANASSGLISAIVGLHDGYFVLQIFDGGATNDIFFAFFLMFEKPILLK